MSKKPRADSVLDNLPPNQRETLERWLFEENVGYTEALKRLHDDFNVKSSLASLSRFYGDASQRRLLQRVAANAQKANAVLAKFEANPSDTYRALLNTIGSIAFDKASQENLDVETIYNLTKLMIAGRKEDTRGELLGLSREKFQRETCELFLKWYADAKARSIAESNASNADKIRLLRQTYFADVEELERSGSVKLPK